MVSCKTKSTKENTPMHKQKKSKSMSSVVYRTDSNGSTCLNLEAEESNNRQGLTNTSDSEPENGKAKHAKSKSVDLSNGNAHLKLRRVNAEETAIKRSASNVESSSKFRLRDLSPSRLRKNRQRKSSDKGSKLSYSPRKNVRSSTSWLPASFQQMLPSYKSKVADFRRLFKNIPESEKLVTDYSCALQRDILVHGRLYVSQNWLCFHANIFGWETLVTIDLQNVTSLTKEKTALVIPNAIQVWTEAEKYFFTSFVSRDSTYRNVHRIWKNVLSKQPDHVTLLIKEVGKYVDVDSEDIDNSSFGSNDEIPFDVNDDDIIVDDDDDDDDIISIIDPDELNSPDKSNLKNDVDEKLLDDKESPPHDSSIPDIAVSPASPKETKVQTADNGDQTSAKVSNGRQSTPSETRRRFPFPFKKEFSPLMKRRNRKLNKKESSNDLDNDSLNRDSLIEDGSVSDSNDDDPVVPTLCPCESHLDIECLNEEFAVDLDTLYEYLFTDCDFFRNFRAARDHYELTIEPWNDDDDTKKRILKYKLDLNLAIGPKTSKIQENQELKASEPGQFYVVETNVVNEGVPYADNFVVIHRYCLSRVNNYVSRLRVTATVKFVKHVWSFIRTMIVKNTKEALNSFFEYLKEYVKGFEDKTLLNPRRRVNSSSNRLPSKEVETKNSSEAEEEIDKDVSVSSMGFTSPFMNNIWSVFRNNSWLLGAFVSLLVILILSNMYLNYKVMSLERSSKSWSVGFLPSLEDSPANAEEFRTLLQQQKYIQNIQLRRWQHVLSTSIKFLEQVQDSLRKLQDEIEKPVNL
ncbi:protein Aster-B-like isoform X3 [Xenia sp. Carnegie-2017]|uniref:protein Aster-B-like isoform X3 n=1 Tax=Xenia sp. Carnegie-2017 TaxID=2897299 RepID=UPI001F03CF4E|nr:protein Aster-B-like isoform X3 [Xenia sp. Carnegie-2017]